MVIGGEKAGQHRGANNNDSAGEQGSQVCTTCTWVSKSSYSVRNRKCRWETGPKNTSSTFSRKRAEMLNCLMTRKTRLVGASTDPFLLRSAFMEILWRTPLFCSCWLELLKWTASLPHGSMEFSAYFWEVDCCSVLEWTKLNLLVGDGQLGWCHISSCWLGFHSGPSRMRFSDEVGSLPCMIGFCITGCAHQWNSLKCSLRAPFSRKLRSFLYFIKRASPFFAFRILGK